MRIGIDGTALTMPCPGGTKTYARHLLEALAKVDVDNEYVVFANQPVELPANNFTLKVIDQVGITSRRQLLTIPTTFANDFEIFHFLDPFGILFFSHPKSLLTVHDLGVNVTHRWQSKNWYKRIFTEWMLKKAIQRSASYIVDSVTIQRELRHYLRQHTLAKRPIHVAQLGVDHISVPLPRNKKSKPFFLALGNFAWRKNISHTIKAYGKLSAPLRNQYTLKIVVSSPDDVRGIRKQIDNSMLNDQVEIMTNVPDEQLYELYQTAVALLYPSLYEGFGLPIVEAMQVGCPVITSNYGAMKEVAGEAGVLVNPYSSANLTNAMTEIATNIKLRRKLITLGKQRARVFTWSKAAKSVVAAYNKLATS